MQRIQHDPDPGVLWELCGFCTGSAADYIHRRQGVYERAREVMRHGGRVGIGLPVLAELTGSRTAVPGNGMPSGYGASCLS